MSLGWNYSLSSISTAWDHSREHWWGLIIFKFIEVLQGLIESLCLKYLVYTSKWRVQLLFFSISSLINFGIVYTKFDLYTKVWIREFGLQFSSFFFFHPKESCTLFKIMIFLRWGIHLYMSLFLSICPSTHLLHTISQEPYII